MIFKNLGGVFRNEISISDGSLTGSETGNAYNVLYASLSILSATPKNPSITSGESYTQDINVVNGGNGAVDEVFILYDLPSEVVLQSTNIGHVSGDTIILQNTDFSGIGNGDNFLDQDENFVVTATLNGVSCSDKTVSGTISAGWSETGGFCQHSSTNTNITMDYENPQINVETIPSLNSCLGTAASEQIIKLTNNGPGVANTINLDIFKSSGGSYDEELLSSFDVSTIQYKVGESGTYESLTPTNILSTRNDGIYSCLGSSSKGAFTVTVPNMAPNEIIYFRWDMNSCCLSTCSSAEIGGWKTDLTYTDACNVETYSSSKVGQSPVGLSMTLFSETDPQVINGENAKYNYIISSYSNTLPNL